jgi:GH15 family glucan-1,4-alpha-glucosidase
MYYPYVGLENHVSGHKHRIGVKVNDTFSWVDDGSWHISIGYKPETMVGYLVCKNEQLQLSLVMEDIVYNENNVFIRQVDIYNHIDTDIKIELFFHQVFMISESKKRNTAFYDPTHNCVVHYKGKRVFIANGLTDREAGIDDYSVGAYQDEGKEGTWRDAEDGKLGRNAVEHGSVDSVVRFSTACSGKTKSTVYYWICAGQSLNEAFELNDLVLQKTAAAMLHSTEEFWHAWISKRDYQLNQLPAVQKKLFDTSLFILRSHVDAHGGIIASADSAMIEYGKDDYSYMWPRDAAFIVSILDKAGFTEVTKPFFIFCKEVLHPDGYLHHRFRSDQSLGSTWHSAISQREWLKDAKLQLPIQEDESASVLVALWKHYQASKDLEFIEALYKPLIEKIAQFLVNFRNADTGLPLASYDLWEERIGVSTYTCCAVYGGLMAAASFSELLGKRNHMRDYKAAAAEIKEVMLQHLYSQKLTSFIRDVEYVDGKVIPNEVVDASSLFGLWYFEVLPQDHPLFKNTLIQVTGRLKNPTEAGGFIRYERDNYFKSTDRSNPWFITTLWEAQRRLKVAAPSNEDLEYVKQTLDWVTSLMYPSGVLAEQINPYTRESLSATPLAWSHAVYIETVLDYVDKVRELDELSHQANHQLTQEL